MFLFMCVVCGAKVRKKSDIHKFFADILLEIIILKQKSRVRDWKGYGVWYKCGTCDPLQSPTDAALERMICRAMEGMPQ